MVLQYYSHTMCTLHEYTSFWLVGRVHSAVISGVNESTASVTVEWFEHNETKGKEVSTVYTCMWHVEPRLWTCMWYEVDIGKSGISF